MIVQPKIRGYICTTAHPVGCANSVAQQIDFVKKQGPIDGGPKKVLVIGASNGYGLASRIVAAFGCQADTVGVFFERSSENNKRTATAGWYNTVAFEKQAQADGLYAKSFNGDAFSNRIRQDVCQTIKEDLGQVDLVIYSLASPRRQHPETGEISKSVLKPIGAPFQGKSLNLNTLEMEMIALEPASDDEIQQTVAVMGGNDWTLWIESLLADDLLAPGANTVAYSYIGPEVTRLIYRNGTIGRAKDHLEQTAKQLDAKLKVINGHAVVSVNKAIVTQSSSAIPFIPLYFVILTRVMKAMNLEESCVEQMHRLFQSRLFNGNGIIVDEQGIVRMDDYEMREEVQKKVMANWERVNIRNLRELADIEEYNKQFLRLFGFGLDNTDYQEDVRIDLAIPSIKS
ncbi:MAG: trans-2-enoyl-CoA reductase family protein [Candidatus Omnitrophica bacterium]|nr:trans-2-enoyl-CoA reductase family protein [Candidatus Omnitrophota bacterium]